MSNSIRRERYKLVPSLREYDKQPQGFVPYLMDLHSPDYRSEIINTDPFGLRKGYIPADYKNTNVIIGGSQAFGVGAPSDDHTLSSVLSKRTGDYWRNMGVRAYNGLQELILFQSMLAYGLKPKKVVILSGINDLYLNSISSSKHHLGTFFSEKSITRKLTSENEEKNLFRSLGKALKNKIKPSQLNPNEFNHYPELEVLLERNISIWSSLGQSLGFDICFVLQPYADWCSKVFTTEEKELFSILDRFQDKSWNEISLKIKRNDTHENFSSMLESICQRHEVGFVDSNLQLDEESKSQWLFADRIHLVDYQFLANTIIDEFLS